MRALKKKIAISFAVLAIASLGTVSYLLRGGFREFNATSYKALPASSSNWNDALRSPRNISLVTLRTGTIHMDACLNLDPKSAKQKECDHSARDLEVLVHWVHHPQFGDFLIDTGFDDSFAKHPPYGNYTEAMQLFNWANGVTNRQDRGEDLAAQLRRLNIHPKAVFFTHLHPDHTAGVPALDPETEFIFGKREASFLARAAVANHFEGRSNFSTLDFSTAQAMDPLGPSIDIFGDGSLWAIAVPGHTDDDVAFLVNGMTPFLLTGDASHFAWAFKEGVAPRGWDRTGTERGYRSLASLREFARQHPNVKIVYGHEQ